MSRDWRSSMGERRRGRRRRPEELEKVGSGACGLNASLVGQAEHAGRYRRPWWPDMEGGNPSYSVKWRDDWR